MSKMKTLAFVLASALAVTSFTACGPETTTTTGEDLNFTTSDKYPLETDVELRYWCELHSNVSGTANSLNDVPFAQYIQEATGIKVKYEHPTQGGITEGFNILQASDDLPDIIEYDFNKYSGGAQQAIDDEFIIALNPYIEKVSPNFKKIINENPDFAKAVMTAEGNYFSYPFIAQGEELATFMTYVVRKDLLDKAGLPVPETYEEWDEVLYKFKEMGVEKPMSFQLSNSFLQNNSPFTSRFGFVGYFYHDGDGKVKFGPYEPAFADYVKMLAKWYEDGIFDNEFTDSSSQRIASDILNGEMGANYTSIGGGLGQWLAALDPASGIELVATKLPSNKKGELAMWGRKRWPFEAKASITATSANKEIAARFLDFGYSEEGNMVYNFGKEGESYNLVNHPVYGENFPQFTDMVDNKEMSMAQGIARVGRSCYFGPFAQSVNYIRQYYTYDQQKEALTLFDSDTYNYMLPTLIYEGDEQQRFTDIMAPINTYREETLAKLVTGKLPLSELDNYFAQLKSLGIEEAIAIQQAAFDRYNDLKPVTFK